MQILVLIIFNATLILHAFVTNMQIKKNHILLFPEYEKDELKVNPNIIHPICVYKAKQNKTKQKHKQTNKYVSSSLRALHFGYQICVRLFFSFLFRNGVYIQISLKWKRKTKIPCRKNKLQNDSFGKSNIWGCFWLICKIDILKRIGITCGIVFVCLSSFCVDKKIAHSCFYIKE